MRDSASDSLTLWLSLRSRPLQNRASRRRRASAGPFAASTAASWRIATPAAASSRMWRALGVARPPIRTQASNSTLRSISRPRRALPRSRRPRLPSASRDRSPPPNPRLPRSGRRRASQGRPRPAHTMRTLSTTKTMAKTCLAKSAAAVATRMRCCSATAWVVHARWPFTPTAAILRSTTSPQEIGSVRAVPSDMRS